MDPSTNSSVGLRYVLIKRVEKDGQRCCTDDSGNVYAYVSESGNV